ncbi:hypothetical protein H5410_039805 [Solanum commersonii]|uniref:Uncharacterized protein n=1 Tax=Solanum commersonii TaxID=4109 RepID=A0A9J5XM07_SOLCO|nr:hypothetical protein H5410_039805 [Solanum commersonii]
MEATVQEEEIYELRFHSDVTDNFLSNLIFEAHNSFKKILLESNVYSSNVRTGTCTKVENIHISYINISLMLFTLKRSEKNSNILYTYIINLFTNKLN